MRLILVYNVNSGIVNSIRDTAHKAISPETYDCNLCSLTYGYVGPQKQWKQFQKQAKADGIELVFLHKDEFLDKYSASNAADFPAIFTEQNGKLEQVVDQKQMNSLTTTEALIEQVRTVLSTFK